MDILGPGKLFLTKLIVSKNIFHDIFEKVVAKQDKYPELVWSARRPAT